MSDVKPKRGRKRKQENPPPEMEAENPPPVMEVVAATKKPKVAKKKKKPTEEEEMILPVNIQEKLFLEILHEILQKHGVKLSKGAKACLKDASSGELEMLYAIAATFMESAGRVTLKPEDLRHAVAVKNLLDGKFHPVG